MLDWSQTYLQLALVLSLGMVAFRCVELWSLEQEIREESSIIAREHLKRYRVPIVLAMAMYPGAMVASCWLVVNILLASAGSQHTASMTSV